MHKLKVGLKPTFNRYRKIVFTFGLNRAEFSNTKVNYKPY